MARAERRRKVEDELRERLDGASSRREALVTLPALVLWRAFFWTYERATWQYDLWVIAILAFVWLTPPAWLRDPLAHGPA